MKKRREQIRFKSIRKLVAYVMVLGLVAYSCESDDDGGDTTVPAPSAAFSASETSVTQGSEVSFTDESTGEATTWLWTFQGGTPGTSIDQNPTVKYEQAGTFDVTLVAANDGGVSEPMVKTGYITVNPITTSEVTITVTADSWRRNDARISDFNGDATYFPLANWADDTSGLWVREAFMLFDLGDVDVSKVVKAELVLFTSPSTKLPIVNNQTLSAYKWSYDDWTDDPSDSTITQATGQTLVDEGEIGTNPLGSASFEASSVQNDGDMITLDISEGVKAETDGKLSMLIKFDTETSAEKLVGRIWSKEALNETDEPREEVFPKLVLEVLDN